MSQQIAIPDDFYIVPSQAASILDVSADELVKMVERGELRDVKRTPGGHRRYNLKEVMALRIARAQVIAADA
jgi:excisionase family DNA binding protein